MTRTTNATGALDRFRSDRTSRIAGGMGVLRCLFGAGMILDPPRLARVLGADPATARRTDYLGAMVGVREIALGVSTLATVRSGGHGVRGWLTAQAMSDGGDAATILAALARHRVHRLPGWLVVAFAAGGVIGDMVALRSAASGD